jgi:hypothetical protein
MVVFGPNQIWSRFGFDLNFKFNRAHSSASSLLCLTHCCRHSAAHCCHLSPRRVPATLEHPGCHSDDDVIVRHMPPPSLPSAEALSPLLRDPTCGALKCRPNALKMEQTTHPPPVGAHFLPFWSKRVPPCHRHCYRWKLTIDRPPHRINHPTDEPNGSGHPSTYSPATPSSLKLHKPAAFQVFPIMVNSDAV